MFYNAKIEVTKRKYELNQAEFVSYLRKKNNYKIIEIAEILNLPKTQVEHWFRKDKYFSIPDSDNWFKLKELLNIDTDKFDNAITEFEIAEGIFDMSGRVYISKFECPTIITQGNIKVIRKYETISKTSR